MLAMDQVKGRKHAPAQYHLAVGSELHPDALKSYVIKIRRQQKDALAPVAASQHMQRRHQVHAPQSGLRHDAVEQRAVQRCETER